LDYDNNGQTGDGNDAFGFGIYPGQYSMVFLSKYPIVEEKIRTFQKFLWKDMADALLPTDPNDTDGDGDLDSYYNVTELAVFRLSSKSHWDIPVEIYGQWFHFLSSHPTPPVFDDGTAEEYPSDTLADWNGLRNHDEIRFWADYIDGADYIYDDAGTPGGLDGCRFVVMGDQNADPVDGDSTFNPILLLLEHNLISTDPIPASDGAAEQVPDTLQDRAQKTSSFNLRVDYVLPSIVGFEVKNAAVFWPERSDLEFYLAVASDHRLVSFDADLVACDTCGGPAPDDELPTEDETNDETEDELGSGAGAGSARSFYVVAIVVLTALAL
jgi:hypothetical protein